MTELEKKELLLELLEGADPQDINELVLKTRYYTTTEITRITGVNKGTISRSKILRSFFTEVGGKLRMPKDRLKEFAAVYKANLAKAQGKKK